MRYRAFISYSHADARWKIVVTDTTAGCTFPCDRIVTNRPPA